MGVRLARFSIGVLLAVTFVVSPVGAQPPQLLAVQVNVVPDGDVQLSLHFFGGVPRGWRFDGMSPTMVTVVLPNTTESAMLNKPDLQPNGIVRDLQILPEARSIAVSARFTTGVAYHSNVGANDIILYLTPLNARHQRPGITAITHASGDSAVASYELVQLKYADVSEVAGVLVDGVQIAPNDRFQPQGSIFTLPTSVNGAVPAQPVVETNGNPETQSLGQKINDHIAIDRRLNAVVLSGSSEQIRSLKSVIEKLDVPLPSVMLECQVVELTENAVRDLGLDLTSGQGSAIASGGLTIANGPAGGAQVSASLSAHLYATIAHGGGRILATPRVLALNGTPAQILTGDALPIIQTTILPGNPPLTQITTNYIAVGVNLQIAPRITSDGFVTSHIYAEVSSVTAFIATQQGEVPQISLRQASTVATVANGTSFVIGGLLKDEEIENTSKVPGLGSLPLVGGLFRVHHDTSSRTNLFIVITPKIITQYNSGVDTTALPKPRFPGATPPPI